VQLSLAEQALRRALEFAPAYPDAITNLGFLLFILGKREEAARLLTQSLAWSTGNDLAPAQRLLRLCSLHSTEPLSADDPSPNRFDCCCGQVPLVQRGKKIGRPRGNEFHQASRCNPAASGPSNLPAWNFLLNTALANTPTPLLPGTRQKSTTMRPVARLAPGMSSITLRTQCAKPLPLGYLYAQRVGRQLQSVTAPIPTPQTASFVILLIPKSTAASAF
jgi:hypothetical protein